MLKRKYSAKIQGPRVDIRQLFPSPNLFIEIVESIWKKGKLSLYYHNSISSLYCRFSSAQLKPKVCTHVHDVALVGSN